MNRRSRDPSQFPSSGFTTLSTLHHVAYLIRCLGHCFRTAPYYDPRCREVGLGNSLVCKALCDEHVKDRTLELRFSWCLAYRSSKRRHLIVTAELAMENWTGENHYEMFCLKLSFERSMNDETTPSFLPRSRAPVTRRTSPLRPLTSLPPHPRKCAPTASACLPVSLSSNLRPCFASPIRQTASGVRPDKPQFVSAP